MIRYTDTVAGITPDRLEGFFVGWPDPPNPETHLRILRGSSHLVLAIDDESSRCVGFVTAITDGVLSAYIPLLEVLPSYRNQGIGTQLMRRMLAGLDGYYMVDLVCDTQLQPYYGKLGMNPATGMMIRNYARQSGTTSS